MTPTSFFASLSRGILNIQRLEIVSARFSAERNAPPLFPKFFSSFGSWRPRPFDKNGLGLSVDKVKRKIEKAPSFFQLLPDSSPIYREWLRIVGAYSVSGVAAHDARIVAAMKVHGLTHLVTFNAQDFRRYEGTEISVLTPRGLIQRFAASGTS